MEEGPLEHNRTMEDIAIYGAGGLGREIALMIEQINARGAVWNLIGFFDDGKAVGGLVDGLPVLGGMNEINGYADRLNVVLCVAEPSIRKKLKEAISNERIRFPYLLHPAAMRGHAVYNKFGEGVIITAGNILTTGIQIDGFAIVNLSCTIGHDVRIGPYSTLMPSCSISGEVRIGEEVLIGSGARILPGVSVGDKSKVGAGAVVLADVPPGETVVGVPGRIVNRKEKS